MATAGFRSLAVFPVGVSSSVELPAFRAGDRSPLFYWGGGAAKPPSVGEYAGPRSLLAFWIGGAHFHYVPPEPPYLPPPYEPIIGSDGPSFLKHHERRRPVNDDAEILEFLQVWTLWNDVE